MKTKGTLEKVRYGILRENEGKTCDFRYLWLASGIRDTAYEIRKETAEAAPFTGRFNIEEVAEHCAEESFHISIYSKGILKIQWNVPSSWKVIPEKAQRVTERVMADVFWRAFEAKEFTYDLFHHPSHFIQGFSFKSFQHAFLSATRRLCRRYQKFIHNYRMVRDWKRLQLLKEQVKLYKNQLENITVYMPLDEHIRNTVFAELSNLERKISLESVDCIINDILIYELSDAI